MKEEREFAGFVLSFAVGIFSVTGSEIISYTHTSAFSSLSLTGIVMLMTALMNPGFRRRNSMAVRIAVPVLGLLCGTFIGTGHIVCLPCTSEQSFTNGLRKLGKDIGSFIENMGFSDQDTGSVLKALITGDRKGMPEHVIESFRDSGAAHILALSGFHLSIIYVIVSKSLALSGGGRKTLVLKSVITATFCGIYTLATGAGPSICRAFIFILLGEASTLFHRKKTTSALLLSALFIQLVLNPLSIRTVSFQLSYAAMAGIAYIFPYMKNLWKKDDDDQWKILRKIWESASMSISCQLTTGPLAFHHFGTLPEHFLLTNLIALPLTALIIPTALLTMLLTSVSLCPAFLVQMTEFLVHVLIRSLEIIAGM